MQKRVEIYNLNKQLAEKLEKIFDHPMTYIHARRGSGRRTAVKRFLAHSDAAFVWHYCEEKEFSEFFRQFCSSFSLFDAEAAALMEETFKADSPESTAFESALILKKKKQTGRRVYVLDSTQSRLSEDIQTFLFHFDSQQVPGVHIVIVARDGGMISRNDSRTELNDIGEECFRLSEKDLIRVAREDGCQLTSEEAIFLMLYTDGWIMLVDALGKEMQENGKQYVFRNIQTLTDAWFEEYGIERQQSTGVAETTPESEKILIIQMLEGLRFEDTEVYLMETLMGTENPERLFYCISMLQLLNIVKGKAKDTLEQLCAMAIRFRAGGHKEDAEKMLNMILFFRVLLGGAYYEEEEDLILFYGEHGWRVKSVFIPWLISFVTMLYKQQYAKVIGCRVFLEKEQLMQETGKASDLYLCLIDLITAIAYLKLNREEEAWSYFEKGQEKIIENKLYLSASWIFDYIMEFTVSPRAAAFWSEDPKFRSTLASFRKYRRRNLGSVISAREKALTLREQECVSLLKEGLTNREIGRQLNISENTVKTNLKSAYRKLGITNRKELQD